VTGWTVLVRGLRFRAGRSLMVLLLATVATTAAAITPAYVRAAQQSVLRDVLVPASAADTSLRIQGRTSRNIVGVPPERLSQTTEEVGRLLAAQPYLNSLLSSDFGFSTVNFRLAKAARGTVINGRLVFLDGICDRLAVTGRCPTATGEVMVSQRTADLFGVKAGEPLALSIEGLAGEDGGKPMVTGFYTPRDPASEFWGLNSLLAFTARPFTDGGGTEFFTTDAIFTGTAEGVEGLPNVQTRRSLAYTVNLDPVDLAHMDILAAELTALAANLTGTAMNFNSGLPGLLKEIKADQEAVTGSVFIGAVPLLVLALFVLMVLVAALTEERGPEIALAKLHGYGPGRIGRFGLGEVLVLVTLAAPLGLLVSWAVLLGVIKWWFAPGTPFEFMVSPVLAIGAALVLTFIAALAASRRVFGARIVQLLRRIPQRTTWRAGALEGAVVALALAALGTAMQDRESGLAPLAAPLLAIVVGIIGGRALSYNAATWLVRARRKADVAGLFSAAQLSRRPGRQRIVVAIAIATSLMGFAATGWDVAAQARAETANGTVGAQQVYRASAADVRQLITGVNAAVPDGSAMAVVRRSEFYDGDIIEVLGVQSGRLAQTAAWQGHSAQELAAVAARLSPEVPPPYEVSGPLTLRIDASGLTGVDFDVVVQISTEAGAGAGARNVTLGRLRQGSHDYTADVGSGTLSAVVIAREVGDTVEVTGTVNLLAITAGGAQLPVGGANSWQPLLPAGVRAELSGDDAVRVNITSSGNSDVKLIRVRAPKALPVLLTGSVPAGKDTPDWTFPAFGVVPLTFAVSQTAESVPGAHGHGMMTDLDFGLVQALDTGGIAADYLKFEVWAGPGAPADLPQRLAEQGVQVFGLQTLDAYSDQLGRRAPALAMNLYALAGLVALLLVLGIVLLVARISAEERCYELAALRVTGVPESVLRKSIRREYLALLGWPSVLGFASGILSAILMLPVIPLVTAGVVTPVRWEPAPGALAAIVVALAGCLLIAVAVSARLVRRASPSLLNGEAQ
jgi:putative ABC transport system permease protein